MEPIEPQEENAPNEAIQFERKMLEHLAEALKGGRLKRAIQGIHDTHLIPIWYAPFMFCGKPGDPQALPDPEALWPCLRKSARVIAWMVVEDILPARDPDTWMPLAFEPVTPDWLVKWSDLEEAAIEHMGLRTGYLEALENGSTQAAPSVVGDCLPHNAKKNYHRLILALASMAGLSLEKPIKAAEALIAKAGLDGIPHPAKAETWAKILKRAKETD